MVVNMSSPFGGQVRTRVLLALRLLSESFPRELARVLDRPLSGVQRALQGLEKDALVSSRPMGRIRLYRLNPRYFARGELERYLLKLTEPEERLRREVEGMRRRPRRPGKPL
jgi:DNA-binding transcriptional ArsR family regulator